MGQQAEASISVNNLRVGGEGAYFDRRAANEGAPESSAAVNAICHLIREQQLWPRDVIALLNAVSCTMASGVNAHLTLHKDIVTSLDQLSDSIGAEAEGL